MSVITKNVNEPYFKGFCKGSPEKIKELCKADTVPANFNEVLSKYTMKGLRVLAISAKVIKMDYMQSQKIERDTVETNMIFLGLLIVQNKLKENTTSSIEVLSEANLRMVMATGDNILTAISVAKECMLIKPDAKIYTCEITKENNNENQLKWNMVETFNNDEDDEKAKDKFILNELPVEAEIAGKGFTQHFSPESIDMMQGSYETRLLVEDQKHFESELKMELHERIDSEVLNIDVEKYPFTNNLEEEFVIAVSGSTFETIWKLNNKYLQTNNPNNKIHNDTFKLLLKNGYIFARMSPEHKTILVQSLREEKLTVCMCGDGANDCGALRAADVGVSLSKEEASIAAHFTSNVPDISCLIKLFREGKASLVTSIQTFKYMMMYSLVQFTSVTLLILINSYLTDNQFLVSDLFIIFPLAVLIARTGAHYKLTSHQPTGALISVPIVSSILIQTIIQFGAQFGMLYLVSKQKWYRNDCDANAEDDIVLPCMGNTVRIIYYSRQFS